MADPLITVAELALWARETIDPADPYANLVVNAASLVVRDTAEHPEWTAAGETAAPDRAKLITAIIAKRAWINSEGIVAEGGMGPLGGDRYIEEVARGMLFEMTEAERETLEGFITVAAGSTGLWTMTISNGPLEMQGPTYAFDSSGSDWMLPFLGAYQ